MSPLVIQRRYLGSHPSEHPGLVRSPGDGPCFVQYTFHGYPFPFTAVGAFSNCKEDEVFNCSFIHCVVVLPLCVIGV